MLFGRIKYSFLTHRQVNQKALWDWEGFRLKNIWIRRTVSRKIACIVGMYTSDPSGQFYSLQYEASTYLRGW